MTILAGLRTRAFRRSPDYRSTFSKILERQRGRGTILLRLSNIVRMKEVAQREDARKAALYSLLGVWMSVGAALRVDAPGAAAFEIRIVRYGEVAATGA